MNDNQTTGHENPNHPMHEQERDFDLKDAMDEMIAKCSDQTREYIENAVSWLKPTLKDELTLLRDAAIATDNSYFENKINQLLNQL